MRKFLLTTAGTALALGLATPGFAQDTVPVERAPFTGLKVEGLIGYDNLSDGSDQESGSSDGLLYGGAVGYDAQVGGVVLGVEGEITGSTTDTRANNLLVGGDELKLDLGRDLYAGGRIGYAVSPDALVYAKGGYTNARVNARYRSGGTTVEDGENLDGYRVGAGVEYNVGTNTYLKGEYRYSHYSEIEDFEIDADRHQVLAGIGVRF